MARAEITFRDFNESEKCAKEKKVVLEPKKSMELKRKFELLDPESIIECPICNEFLYPPVYQCENGHMACSACRLKINIRGSERCPYCRSDQMAHSRCLAVEKLLESLLTSCKYSSQGCTEMVKMINRKEHENDLCKYRPKVPEVAATTVQNKSNRTGNSFGMLMPWLQSRLAPVEFEHLGALHQKYKQKEYTKVDFLRRVRGIVSDRILKQSFNRMKLEMIASAQQRQAARARAHQAGNEAAAGNVQ